MIKEYVIENKFLKVTMLNVGCVIKSMIYKPLNQEMVISLNNNIDYLKDVGGIGCGLVGPFAGRIADAKYKIDGEEVNLSKNFKKKHHLHGGDYPLSQEYYEVDEIKDGLIFKKKVNSPSTNNQDLNIEAIFKLEDNKLISEIIATSDRDVVFNPTNHTYYNFDQTKDILDYKLDVDFDYVYYLDEESIIREKVSESDSIFNKLNGQRIGDSLVAHEQFDKVIFIDHPFKLSSSKISLSNDKIKLTIDTSSDHVVIYTANYLDGLDVSMNVTPKRHMGICLETQCVPNVINIEEEKKKVIVNKDHPFYKKDIYQVEEV